MEFHADLHIHSKYSRATSRQCDPEHLSLWARRKGISVLGTGDFTHPAWLEELGEKLQPAEPGLYRLRPDLERQVEEWLGDIGGQATRFLLQVEISTIYKKGDRTRKVHHVVCAPDLDKAGRLGRSLAKIGNVTSDGRPILGLDSRHLLEITLEAGEGCFLIPAHIWTPWFAVLGSKSGFDSIEECYGDLTPEIFAVETGLSSDPPMNRRLSSLDRFALVSNSDAHSPAKIGREACIFDTDLDYFAMRRALETGAGYLGTVEFFPDEGKYHLDGHRKCGVCLSPEETRRCDALCPECGKPLTLGVLHRVCELADRDEGATGLPSPYRCLVPLEEVLAEILGVGAQSKRVRGSYEKLLVQLGPELHILEHADTDDIQRAGSPLLAEAIERMRAGRVVRKAGYDGEYGRIRLFEEGEIDRRTSGALLFDLFGGPGDAPPSPGSRSGRPPVPVASPEDGPGRVKRRRQKPELPAGSGAEHLLDGLDPEQRSAAEAFEGPLLIEAGPGTGKTRTLICRLAHLIREHGADPESCLAVTFTRRAAGEMMERLEVLLPECGRRAAVRTFHSLGLSILREHADRLGLPGDFRIAGEAERASFLADALSLSLTAAHRLLSRVSSRKRQGGDSETAGADGVVTRAFETHERWLRREGRVDLDDLIVLPVSMLEADPGLVAAYRSRYRWLSLDEFQDIDAVQYRLVRLLAPPDGNVCAIGDPDQSIYGFRGADPECFERFARDYPTARTVRLKTSYRSTRAIVDGALQMISSSSRLPDRLLEARGEGPEHIEIHECSTDKAEAELVVHTIERTIGGSTFFSMDSGRVSSHEGDSLGFSDFAVLYRTEAQAACLVEAFQRSGMPFRKHSHSGLGEVPAVRELLRYLERVQQDAAAPPPLPEGLERALALAREDSEVAAGLEPYIEPLRALAERRGADASGFLSDLALGVDVDLWDPRAQGVSLLTLHASKGLEFPVVFIVGCEDGILPLHWNETDRDAAEERRLFFVGMTRARWRLCLTYARRRCWRGTVRSLGPSPFLNAIEERLKALEEHQAHRKRGTSPFRQLTLFE